MNAQNVFHSATSASGSTTCKTAVSETMDWWTWFAETLQQGWNQIMAPLWSAIGSNPRVFDLGVLDDSTQVRSRNFGNTILFELVGPNEELLGRREVERDSIDFVRVSFSCSDSPLDIPSSQFDEGDLTYIDIDDAIPCGIMDQGLPIAANTLYFPPMPSAPSVPSVPPVL